MLQEYGTSPPVNVFLFFSFAERGEISYHDDFQEWNVMNPNIAVRSSVSKYSQIYFEIYF